MMRWISGEYSEGDSIFEESEGKNGSDNGDDNADTTNNEASPAGWNDNEASTAGGNDTDGLGSDDDDPANVKWQRYLRMRLRSSLFSPTRSLTSIGNQCFLP